MPRKPTEKEKNILYFGLSTVIIIALIYLADSQKFLDSVSSAQPLEFGLSIVFGIAVFLIFAFTWHRFLSKIGVKTGFVDSFRLFMAGQFMNSITPLGQLGGEPVMAYIIQDNQDTSYEKALSAVVSADIVNTVPYITFMLGGAFYLLVFDSVQPGIAQTSLATMVIALIGGAFAYSLWFKAEKLEKIFKTILEKLYSFTGFKVFSGLEENLEELRETLDSIGEDPVHLVTTAAVAHLAFGFQVISLYFVLSSISESVGLVPLYFVIAVSSLANFSPTPGGSGTFEGAMAGVLTPLSGIGFAQALTVGILYRVSTYWSGLLIGYISILGLRRGEKLDKEDLEEKIPKMQNQ